MTRVAELAWTEVEERLARGALAILPIGAASKEHGPHLPMSTDWLTAEALGAAIARERDALVWPSVGYGFYPAFVDYPGSTSLGAETFRDTTAALLADLSRAGARATLVLNTGISTIRPVEAAVSRSSRCAVLHVYRGARYAAAVAAICEQERGGHADEAETSVMLALHPELVRMERAPRWTREVRPGRWSRSDAESGSYSPSGVYGDATLATAAKGERLLRAMIDDACDALDRLAREG